MKNIHFLLSLLFGLLLISCGKDNSKEKEITAIPVQLSIERFEQKFKDLDRNKLQDLKNEYPFLFPPKYDDSIWLLKSKDTLQSELRKEVLKKFPDLKPIKNDITDLFKHIKYYFPEIKVPRIVTVTSDVNYEQKVILADSLLLISLDTYLGKEHHFYQGIQQFIRKNFEEEQVIPDVAARYVKEIIPLPKDRTFLANLIFYGKELYTKSILLPDISEEVLLGYTKDEYEWAQANEEQIWRFFIDRELLYNTDKNLNARFLYPGPFSKFNLQQIDNESPDRIGQFIGWQIVKSYMKNKNVSLRKMIIQDAEQIFQASRYKPKKK